MKALLDSSVLIAALTPDEERHSESLMLLMQGGNSVYSHAILETFSTLTGGRLGVKVGVELALRLITDTIIPQVNIVELGAQEVIGALTQSKSRGVRVGGVYDFMHLVAARKAGVEIVYTINCPDFQHLIRAGDPEVRYP